MARPMPKTVDSKAQLANLEDDLPDPTARSVELFKTPAQETLDELPDDPTVDAYLAEETALDALMAELGGEWSEGTVTINKKSERSKKFEWVDKITATDFVANGMPYLAQYGSGEYLLLIYSGGTRGMRKRKIITISEAASAREQAKLPPSIAASPSAEVAALAGSIKEMQTLIMQLAKNVSAPRQDSVADKMREYLLIRDTFGMGAASHAVPAPVDPIKMFQSVLDMVRDMQPPDDGPSGMMDIAEKFMKTFGPMINRVVEQAQTAPALAAPAAAAATPGAQPAPAPNAAEGEKMFEQMMIKYFLNTLIVAASQDADPETYADMILDQVPDETIEAWINQPTLIDELQKYDARVAKFPDWFARLRTAILEFKAEDSKGESETIQ